MTSPLVGNQGAAFIYGPQKGCKQDDLARLDQGIEHIIRIYLDACLSDSAKSAKRFDEIQNTPGSGASGGSVAAFLACVPQTKIVSGLDFIAAESQLDDKIRKADIVITGEGSFDE